MGLMGRGTYRATNGAWRQRADSETFGQWHEVPDIEVTGHIGGGGYQSL